MFRVGDRVIHNTRGRGFVTSVDDITGKTQIRFDNEKSGDHGYDATSLASGKIQLEQPEEGVSSMSDAEVHEIDCSDLSENNRELVQFLQGVSVFQDLIGEQLIEVISTAQIVSFGSDDEIFHQGDSGDAFYLILEGVVRVNILGESSSSSLCKGDHFGERALETGEVRAATVVCVTSSKLLKVLRHDYEKIVGSMSLVSYISDPKRRCAVQRVEEMLLSDTGSAKNYLTQQNGEKDYPLHLHLISDFVNEKIVAKLVSAHPEATRLQGSNFMLPLHLYLKVCVEHQRPTSIEVVRILLRANPLAVKIPFNNQFPVHLHLRKNSVANLDVVKELERAHPEGVRYNGSSGTALASYLCDSSIDPKIDPRIVRFLLDLYPEAARDRIGAGLPIHWQCLNECADEEVIEALIKAYPDSVKVFADTSASDDEMHMEGDLPLHCYLYCMHAKPSLVQMLIDADPESTTIPNANGDLPLHTYIRANRNSNENRHVEYRKRLHSQAVVKTAEFRTAKRTGDSVISDKIKFNENPKPRRYGLAHSVSSRHLHLEGIKELRKEHKRKIVESNATRQWVFSSMEDSDKENEKIRKLMEDYSAETDYSDYKIDERVILTLIQSNPHAVNKRCIVKERNRNQKARPKPARQEHTRSRDSLLRLSSKREIKRRSNETRRLGILSRLNTCHDRGGKRNSVDVEEAHQKGGELPLEIYITYTPAELINSKALSLLMGCIDMRLLFDIEDRPRYDDDLVNLSLSRDRYDLEKWVRESLIHGLTKDQLRTLELDDAWGESADHSKNDMVELNRRLKTLVNANNGVFYSTVRDTPQSPQCAIELSMSGVELEVANAVALHLVEIEKISTWTDLLRMDQEKLRESLTSSSNMFHKDDIRLICDHIRMMKLSYTIYGAHTAYLLTCIPLSSPRQYSLSASEGVVMQARIFSAMMEHLERQNKSTIAHVSMLHLMTDFVYEFATDDHLLSELKQSSADRASIEVLTANSLIQTALIFRYYQGPHLVFILDFVLFCSLALMFFLGTSYFDNSKERRILCAILSTPILAYFIWRHILLIHELRRQELKAAALEKSSLRKILTQKPYFRNFLLASGLSVYLPDEEFWSRITVLMLIAVSTSMMWIMMGNTRNSEVYKIVTGSAAFLMWSKLIGFIQNTYKQFSIYVGMIIGIIRDAFSFILLFVLVYLMFVHVFSIMFLNEDCYSEYDDEEERIKCQIWKQGGFTHDSLLTMGIMTLGETGLAQTNIPDDNPIKTSGLFLFLFIIVIVLMNVLIAIVSDSYDDAITRADMLFWCNQLDLMAESAIVYRGGSFPVQVVQRRDAMRDSIKRHIMNIRKHKAWSGKILESCRRIETDAEFKAKRVSHELSEMKQEIIDEVRAMLQEQKRSMMSHAAKSTDSMLSNETGMKLRHKKRNQRLGALKGQQKNMNSAAVVPKS